MLQSPQPKLHANHHRWRFCQLATEFSSGHPHVDPVAPLKTDMEGSSETPYDPSSAFDPPVDPVAPMKTDVEGPFETPYDPSSAFDSHVDPVAPMKTDM
jgi:hypothetical protein